MAGAWHGFCPVCRGAWITRTLAVTSPTRSDVILRPQLNSSENLTGQAISLIPSASGYEVSWVIDGATIASLSGKTSLSWQDISVSAKKIEVVVTDKLAKETLKYNPYNINRGYNLFSPELDAKTKCPIEKFITFHETFDVLNAKDIAKVKSKISYGYAFYDYFNGWIFDKTVDPWNYELPVTVAEIDNGYAFPTERREGDVPFPASLPYSSVKRRVFFQIDFGKDFPIQLQPWHFRVEKNYDYLDFMSGKQDKVYLSVLNDDGVYSKEQKLMMMKGMRRIREIPFIVSNNERWLDPRNFQVEQNSFGFRVEFIPGDIKRIILDVPEIGSGFSIVPMFYMEQATPTPAPPTVTPKPTNTPTLKPTFTPVPVPTKTPTPTVTPIPTITPKPTATPTITPKPTVTPIPLTPTPVSKPENVSLLFDGLGNGKVSWVWSGAEPKGFRCDVYKSEIFWNSFLRDGKAREVIFSVTEAGSYKAYVKAVFAGEISPVFSASSVVEFAGVSTPTPTLTPIFTPVPTPTPTISTAVGDWMEY